MSNEPDRDRRERLERARLDLLDEHLNPVYLDAARIDREAVAKLGVAELLRALQALRLPRSTSSPRECDDAARRDRAALGGGRRPPLPRAARDRPRRRAPVRRRPPLPRARARRAPTRPTGCCPRSRRPSATSGSTCARRRTSTSTSSSGPGKSPRAFCSPIEVPGKVMLVIQPIGGHDDWRALFHEAGHTEHYANTSRRPADGGEAARRHGRDRGLGDALRAPRRRAGLAEPPPRRARVAKIANEGAVTRALLPAPLQREAPLRDRVLPGRRPRSRCGRATPSC